MAATRSAVVQPRRRDADRRWDRAARRAPELARLLVARELVAGVALAAAELESAARALPGLVAPLHCRGAADATLDGGWSTDVGSHARKVGPRSDGWKCDGRPDVGARKTSLLEEPDEEQDDDDERDETAADVHSGLLLVIDGGTTAPGVMRLRRSLRWRRGAVAEWLGRGLQSLAHQFDSGRRLLGCFKSRQQTRTRATRTRANRNPKTSSRFPVRLDE